MKKYEVQVNTQSGHAVFIVVGLNGGNANLAVEEAVAYAESAGWRPTGAASARELD